MNINAVNIKKSFDDFVLFENFNLKINKGEFVGLYGASGSGKTTILNILGLIEDYDSGSIEYNNHKIVNNKQKRKLLREEIGFIFQDFALINNKSIAYNFKFIKNSKIRIEEALEFVGLSYLSLKRKIYTLSGGEQQRVAIAKVIYKGCSVIFADEATASVDENNKEIIMEILSKLAKTGSTILFVTHDKTLKENFDRIIYLANANKSNNC